MNQQDEQAIEGLFRQMYQTAQQSGPRDLAAEELIDRYVRQAPPGLLYHMAQTLVAQQHALNRLRAQSAGNGAPAGFAEPGYGQPGYGQPAYQQGYGQAGYQQQQNHGFLSGAGKIALGVGGGIIGAEVADDIFHDVENLFDGGGFGGGGFGGGPFGGGFERDRGFDRDRRWEGERRHEHRHDEGRWR